jgi:hypothetical protein
VYRVDRRAKCRQGARTVQFGGLHDHHHWVGEWLLLHDGANRSQVFSGQATSIYRRRSPPSAVRGFEESQRRGEHNGAVGAGDALPQAGRLHCVNDDRAATTYK